MSPHKATGLRQFQTITLQSKFFRGGPVSKQSFIEGLRWFALANASKTIRILVLCAASLMTAFLGENVLFPLESHRSLSPQYLVLVGSGLFVIPI